LVFVLAHLAFGVYLPRGVFVEQGLALIAELQRMLEKREPEPIAGGEAIRMAEVAEAEDAVYDPGDDFQPAGAYGAYSALEIARVRDRQNRFNLAWAAKRRPNASKKSRIRARICREKTDECTIRT
jgi:hypothetical protein